MLLVYQRHTNINDNGGALTEAKFLQLKVFIYGNNAYFDNITILWQYRYDKSKTFIKKAIKITEPLKLHNWYFSKGGFIIISISVYKCNLLTYCDAYMHQ